MMGFTGGNRARLLGNQTSFHPGTAQAWVLPAANRNLRWSFQDDLTWTRGRHNFKFGFYGEWASKTEPLSHNYMGNYNFGHNAQNPLSTGNGYANALLGVFTTYTELTNRVDRDRRHWQTEGYVQDSWRMHPRLTLDYGVRFTHSGGYYDTRKSTAGFYEPDWNRANAPRLYQPVCTTGVPGNQTCAANNQRAVDPANPTVSAPGAFIGNLVPGTGSQINGMVADGYPGHAAGRVLELHAARGGAAGRLRLGHQRRRQAGAARVGGHVLRDSPARNTGRTSSATRRRRSTASSSGRVSATSRTSRPRTSRSSRPRVTAEYAGGEQRSLEKSYNVNVTYQRDIGFNTTAEVAYVGSWTYAAGAPRTSTGRSTTCICSATRTICSTATRWTPTSCARHYPGMGAINNGSTRRTAITSTQQTLQYNAMQVNVQRRLNRGLQMGLAYTLARGRRLDRLQPGHPRGRPDGCAEQAAFLGADGQRPDAQPHGELQLHDPERGAGHTDRQVAPGRLAGLRRHEVPERDGDAAQLHAATTRASPSRTRRSRLVHTAACVFTGEPHLRRRAGSESGRRGSAALQPARVRDGTPLSATVGNFGNVPLGILRNPGWWNWDMTFARRFPCGRWAHGAQVRLQLQIYNIFNMAQFTRMDTNLQFAGRPERAWSG